MSQECLVARTDAFQSTFKEDWGGFGGAENTERAQHYNSVKNNTRKKVMTIRDWQHAHNFDQICSEWPDLNLWQYHDIPSSLKLISENHPHH